MRRSRGFVEDVQEKHESVADPVANGTRFLLAGSGTVMPRNVVSVLPDDTPRKSQAVRVGFLVVDSDAGTRCSRTALQ